MEINRLISKYNFYKSTESRIKYIVIHYVGSLASAEANANYFAMADRGSSAHYFVGHDGVIWQSVEDANAAWHCGSKTGYKHPECRNANSIGIEMCVRKANTKSMNANNKDWYFEDATVDSTVELTKYLMKKYNIPPKNVIRHYDVTGKVCPAPYVHNNTNHTWDEFKQRIQNGGENTTVTTPSSKPVIKTEDNAAFIWRFFKNKGLNDFGIAGLMGNLQAESGLSPINLQNSYNKKLGLSDEEYTKRVDNGSYTNFVRDSAGYGLAQWTYWSRKIGLFNSLKQSGKSIGDLEGQCEFLYYELSTSYRGVLSVLMNAHSVKEASDCVLTKFERPADQGDKVKATRLNFANIFYSQFAKK